MATFTTEQATSYLRKRLNDPTDPTPFVIVEYAHKTQNFTEIETRLQGHFGQHDHAPSLRIIARDAVCNLMLEHERDRRGKVEQASAIVGHAEALLNAFDHNRTDAEALRYLDEITKAVASLRVALAPKLIELTIAAADVRVGDLLYGSPVAEAVAWVDDGGKTRRKGRKFTCEAGGVYWFYDTNEITIERPALSPAPPVISTCEKCRQETTETLIEVDAEDFDPRVWDGENWTNPGTKIARRVCGGCCRGSR